MENKLPCDGKASYPSKALADAALKRIIHDRNRTMQVPRYSFLCPHCNTHHLSSRPDKRDLNLVLNVLGLTEQRRTA